MGAPWSCSITRYSASRSAARGPAGPRRPCAQEPGQGFVGNGLDLLAVGRQRAAANPPEDLDLDPLPSLGARPELSFHHAALQLQPAQRRLHHGHSQAGRAVGRAPRERTGRGFGRIEPAGSRGAGPPARGTRPASPPGPATRARPGSGPRLRWPPIAPRRRPAADSAGGSASSSASDLDTSRSGAARATTSRVVRSPTRRRASCRWSIVRSLPVLGEELQVELEVGKCLGIDEVAQLLTAHELGQHRAGPARAPGPAVRRGVRPPRT